MSNTIEQLFHAHMQAAAAVIGMKHVNKEEKVRQFNAYVPSALGMLMPQVRQAVVEEAQAPEVAPSKAPAKTGNLIAKINYQLVAGNSFTQIHSCLRIHDVVGGMLPTIEVRPERLTQHSRRGFKNVGPYVEVTVEANAKQGQLMAKHLMGNGLVIGALKGTIYEHTRWVMSGVVEQKTQITLLMTPTELPNFWALVGYQPKGNAKTVAKRLRRSMTDGNIEFFGRLLTTIESVFYFEGGDGVVHEVPCTDAVYEMDSAILEGQEFIYTEPQRMVVGYVRIDKSEHAQKVLGITDGCHGMAPSKINELIHAADPKHVGYCEGDGVRVTFDSEEGQAKGHGVFRYFAHRTMVVFDTKKEFVRIDGTVRLVIADNLHRPRTPRTDPQSVNNFRLAQAGFLSEFGKEFIGKITAAIGDADALNTLFDAFMQDRDYTDTFDAMQTGDLPKGKTSWVLAANVAQAKETFFAVAPDGTTQLVDMHDVDGTKLDVWQSPRLAKRGCRHMTETVLQIEKMRVPISNDKAVRAYAMCDISIFDHEVREYNGKGIFLSNGVLKGRQGVVFNIVLDENGMPKVNTKSVLVKDADGYYTRTDKTTPVIQMVEGPACTHRQPNGWAGEIERDLELVKSARYEKMSRSPFIYFSCDSITVEGEAKEWLTNLIGAKKLAGIIALWSVKVPFIVLLNAILGGGDLDDLHMILIYDKLVAFLRSEEERAFVRSYPNEDLTLEPNVVVSAVEPNSYLARMQAKKAASVSSTASTFGRREYYQLLKLMNAAGLVAKLSNTAMIWVERLNEGDPIPVNLGGYTRNLEGAVDAEMKTGEDVAGAAKRCDEVTAAVVRVSKFLERRLPWDMRQEPKYEVVEGAIDRELAILRTELAQFQAAFKATYLNPNEVQVMEYMLSFAPDTKAEETANAWRQHYNDVRMAVKGERESWLAGADFETVSAEEKTAFAIADSVKAGDEQAFDSIAKALYESDPALMYRAVIAMYNSMLTMKVTKRSEETGELMERPDALLYADKCNTVLREAMRYAKVQKLFPDTTVLEAQCGNHMLAAERVGPALPVVNGMAKADAEELKSWLGTAARHAKVILRALDPKNAADMNELWAKVPVLRGKQQEAILVTRKTGEQTQYGWIAREAFGTWHLHAQGCKTLSGTLSRSVNTRTGEFNPFSVQVNLDLE